MRISLGYQVLIAVVLGIATGLFFGPFSSVLSPVGDVFSMLLQMVTLPYIVFSLMHGIGSLTPHEGKTLFKKGWFILLIMWALVYLSIYLLNLLLPSEVSGSITYSPEQAKTFSKEFLTYIVPANPIYDFANNIVPAIAVFGVILGSAIMHLQVKEPLLELLERSNVLMEKILEWLAIISPIGIFAHISVAFGTVNFEDLSKLEFYVFCFIAIVAFLVLWVLPKLICCFTPLKYKEVIKEYRFTCVLAFATGLPSIAFPFINKSIKRLAARHSLEGANFQNKMQTIVPFGFSFAQLGNCLMLFFIMFISFFYRHPFLDVEKVLLNFLTIPMSFGTTGLSLNAMSFLIKLLQFPKDAFNIYVEIAAVTSNFQVLLSVASIYTFVLLVLFSYHNKLKIQWKRISRNFFLTFGIFTLCIFALKKNISIGDNFAAVYSALSMEAALGRQARASFVPKISHPGGPSETFSRILTTNTLRVGCNAGTVANPDNGNIPFCYYNDKHELVGYDTAFAYELAHDLDCKLEFVNIDVDELGNELSNHNYDIAMSSVVMSENRLLQMDFTHTYFEDFNVLVVPAFRKKEFLNYSQVVQKKDLVVGGLGAYFKVAQNHFPNAKVISVKTLSQFEKGEFDAMVWSRLAAFVWGITHPNYIFFDYNEMLGQKYFSYAIPMGADNWASFLNSWLELKKQSGFTDRQYHYWIEASSVKEQAPRWSIIRNVLHWVD